MTTSKQSIEKLIYESMRLQTRLYEAGTKMSDLAKSHLNQAASNMSTVLTSIHESKKYI